jgi:hypothetical protein
MTQNSGLNNQAVSHGIELRLDSAISGCANAFPPGITALQVRNVTFNQADLNAKLVSLDSPFKGARSAHASLRTFTSQKSQYTKDAEQFLADLKAVLAGALGSDNQLLVQWGFKVTKPKKPLTAEQKVLRAAKAKLTRQKRGTLGRKQKAAIKATSTPDVMVSADGTSSVVSQGSNGNGATTPPATSGNVVSTPPAGSGGNAAQ